MRDDGPMSAWWELNHILSRLGLGRLRRLEEHRKFQTQTLFGRFVRNSVRFYVCFSALWKLAVRNNNTKVQANINLTKVGKVTLHV